MSIRSSIHDSTIVYEDLAETFNTFFMEAVNKLDIVEDSDMTNLGIPKFDDPVDIEIKKIKHLPSILIIKNTVSKIY